MLKPILIGKVTKESMNHIASGGNSMWLFN